MDDRPITINVTGKPIAKGRARHTKAGITFTPAATRKWEADARHLARLQMGERRPLTGPLWVTVLCRFVPPASWPTWKRDAALADRIGHTSKPDGDNVAKAAKDALNGVVWLDDAQVVVLAVLKRWALWPAVEIEIRPVAWQAPSQITRRADLPAAEGAG